MVGHERNVPVRQAGGHWFEPSTAHLGNPPVTAGFCIYEPRRHGSVYGEWPPAPRLAQRVAAPLDLTA
jgi:hypothetical protein